MLRPQTISWSRLAKLCGELPARFKGFYNKLEIFWPWADKILVLFSFIILVFRTYGNSPYVFMSGLVFPLVLLIIVFRSPLLKPPLPTPSGFIGMVLSYPALTFLDFHSRFNPYFSTYVLVLFVSVALFYIINLMWALFTMRRSFAIFPSIRIVVTGGPYSVVRHPIYSAYLHLAICFTLVTSTIRNIVITAIFALGLYLRAKCEEELLEKAGGYGAFRNRIKNRFFNTAYSAPAALVAAIVIVNLLWRISMGLPLGDLAPAI